MTIGTDARAAAAQRETEANQGFANSAVVNLALQATERDELTAYFESIKPAVANAVIATGRYRGEFRLDAGLLRTTGKPPPRPGNYVLGDPQHPYNAVWNAFVAWATSENLKAALLKDSKYVLPPPAEGYAFDVTI